MFRIAPTDIGWFTHLRREKIVNDINFWTPTPWNVKMSKGDRLYFMLKSPIRKIGGGGYFKSYQNMTVEQAWDKYGIKNGFDTRDAFVDSLTKHRSKNTNNKNRLNKESLIGCIVLEHVVFLDDDKFIELESESQIVFKKQIVTTKQYDDKEDDLLDRIFRDGGTRTDDEFSLVDPEIEKDKVSAVVTKRFGQGKFRADISEIYLNKCCVTGEATPELLEAAHIQSYKNVSSNNKKNGLLLRVDIHKLFDKGLMYIDEKYIIHISPFVKSDNYRLLEGQKISLPNNVNDYPSLAALALKESDFRGHHLSIIN